MPVGKHQSLSRRERQIMDIIHARRSVSAADVEAALPDAPSYSTVRTLLRILEEKGHLKHRVEAGRYIYSATESRSRASQSALKRLVDTFFEGSLANAVSALVDSRRVPREELDRLEEIVKQARRKA